MLRCWRSMTNRSGPIREALSEVLAPLAAVDGGRIYLVQIGDQVVSLHWAGRYAGSPASALLHSEVAVPLIRQVAPDTVVYWSSGHIVPASAELIQPSSAAIKNPV
jgi:hypothetical protein